jgi:hypothetical protein
VGGVGTVNNGMPLPDADRDGMPDAWETAHGLNPNNAEDRNKTNLSPDNYTNLEMYLNELAGDPVRWNTTALRSSNTVASPRRFSLTVRNLTIDLPAGTPINVERLDLSGRVVEIVYKGPFTPEASTLSFDRGGKKTSGAWLLRIRTDNREYVAPMMNVW